jgi:hypothetical protein
VAIRIIRNSFNNIMGKNHDDHVRKEIKANGPAKKPHKHTKKCPDNGYACPQGVKLDPIAEMKKDGPLVIIYIRGGAVQDIDSPPGVQVLILDFDNCPTCGGLDCQSGYIQPCPSEV